VVRKLVDVFRAEVYGGKLSMSRSAKSSVRVGDGIKGLIGILKTRLSRNEYVNGMNKTFVRRLGGKYWKMLNGSGKMSYLFIQKQVIQDQPNSDNHLGDADFQHTVIGGVNAFVTAVSSFMSKTFNEEEVFEWPDKIVAEIQTSSSAFEYGKLIQDTAGYLPEIGNEATNGRRYDSNGKPKIMPICPVALSHFFGFLDQIWFGIEKLMSLDAKAQEEALIEGVVPNTNVGYPFFTKQTKDNFKTLWRKFQKLYLGKEYAEGTYLTVSEVFDVLHEMIKRKYHFPYVLFYRTQIGKGTTKHRSVYGAHIVQKMLAALFAAAKKFAFSVPGNFLVDKHVTKYIYSVGGMPIVAQLNWDEMFQSILKRLPDFDGDKIRSMSANEIRSKFDVVLPPGEYIVNAIGEDFPRFDTGMIYEDFVEIRNHPKLGWILSYILDDLRFSEVWTANLKIYGIFFKSGHPMTSEFGSYFHRKAQYNAAGNKRKITHQPVYILSATNLSDDSIMFVINLDPEDINSYLKEFGLEIKVKDSFNFMVHKIVEFLKVLVGYVLKDSTKTFIGDPTSRYVKIAHSEREIEQSLEDPEDYEADVRGIYRVTGDIEVDALISKLASFGNSASIIVYTILRIIKNTKLGRSVILAISHIDPSAAYELYRSDVPFGFNPAWLGTLEVQALLFERSYQ